MKSIIPQSLLLLTCLLVTTGTAYAQSTSLPAGWLESYDARKDAIAYKKQGDKHGTIVKIYPKELLEQRDVDTWLQDKLSSSKAPKGQWLDDLSLTRATANLAIARRGFELTNGKKGLMFAVAFSADRLYVRLGVSIHTYNASSQTVAKEAIQIVSSNVAEFEKADAIKEQRGLDLEVSPPDVEGIKQGGVDIKPGRYVGTSTYEGKVKGKHEIMLYANGEYEFLNSGDSGRFFYSEATGRLDMEDDFYNSTYEPSDNFSIYGINKSNNKHIIYAEDDHFFSSIIYKLTWVNVPDRHAPSIQKDIEKQKELVENAYKFITAPGDGLSSDDIENVLYVSDLKISVGGVANLDAEAYVLMKDGRVIDAIPVAPFVLDVAKSRSRDPDRWGWWKQQNDGYAFAWSIDQKKFVIPNGNQTIANPVPAESMLDGTWKASKTFTSLDLTSVSFWGVTFSKDGRFVKFSQSMTTAGGELDDLGPLVGGVTTDDETVSFIIGSNIGGGSKSSTNKPKNDREGTYEFNGYNLTLNFDSGRTVHALTFSAGDNHRQLWFEGDSMLREDKKQ